MSQPVKISDPLLLDARLVSELTQRSIAGQIEFWAHLGRAIEPLLNGDTLLALRKSGDAKTLSELLMSVDTDVGRQRVADFLVSQPFPHYQPAPHDPRLLIRIEEDGTRTLGRFVKRKFVPVRQAASPAKKPGKKRPAKTAAKDATPRKRRGT